MAKIGVCVKNLTSGGAEKQAVLLANVMSSYHDVDFIILNSEKVHVKYLDMLLPAVRLVKFSGDIKDRYSQYKEYIRTSAPDLIFSYLTAANYYSVKASRGTSTKVVTGIRNSRLPLKKHIVDAILHRFYAVASVCNCESGRKHFGRTGFKRSKIEVIPNCFAEIEDYEKHPSSQIVKVITVGRFVAQKDYPTAIKAFALAAERNKNLRFTIIGYGELEKQIRDLVHREGIEAITDIKINSSRIADELRDSDIYLSTSLFEGISNSIMEGMNANLPIVATNVGDNEALVADGVNGYLTSKGDYQKISQYILELADDAQLRERMGRKSKEALIAKYTSEKFASHYNRLISKLLGR